MAKNKYDAEQIETLEGLNAVRKRYSMYISGSGDEGLHHLILEALGNAADEGSAGFGNLIRTRIYKDEAVSVEDFGRGIPVNMHPKFNVSAMEIAFTKLHAGGKMNSNAYKNSIGLNGIGLKAINALSVKTEATVFRDGAEWYMEFSRGEVVKPLTKIRTCTTRTGTIIKFYPDKEIFKANTKFKLGEVKNQIKGFAFLNPNIQFELVDERVGFKELFHYPNGLLDMISEYKDLDFLLDKPIQIKATKQDTTNTNYEIDIVFMYTNSSSETIHAFGNGVRVPQGGTHVTGFKTALTRAVNDVGRDLGLIKPKESNITGGELKDGLLLCASAKVPEPEFEGQTKNRLTNANLTTIVSSLVYDYLKRYFDDHPKELDKIIEKALLSRRIREAQRKIRENILNKNPKEKLSVLSSKFADCSSKDWANNEIYIVEGRQSLLLKSCPR